MDSWFSEEASRAFAWFSLLSLLSLLGPYALLGRHRKLVLSAWVAALALGVICLGAAIVALLLGQPAHVIRPLALVGVVVTVVFAGLFRTLTRAYEEAELRRMIAQDLR